MKIFRFICCLFLLTGSAFSQILTVKDQSTDRLLEYVYIYSKNPSASAMTDSKGRVDLSYFLEADSIHIELIGFKSIIISFDQLVKNEFILYLKEAPFYVDQVVVSATRWELEKQNIPNKISTIRPLQVHMQNPQTAADLIGNSEEVFIQKSQLGGGSPMIRGFAANRVLISIDGIRMNTAIFRSGNLQTLSQLIPLV